MYGRNVFIWSLVIALGGFLFGFDTAVISGAERSIQTYWKLTAFQHGLTISIALIGTVIGSLLGGIPCDRLGRKATLFGIGAFYLISSLGTSLTTHWSIFLAFRSLGGLGVGASLLSTVGIGIVNFSFTLLAMNVSDKAGGGNTFLFFSVMMCLQLLFVWKWMPETKGTSLEQIDKTLVLH